MQHLVRINIQRICASLHGPMAADLLRPRNEVAYEILNAKTPTLRVLCLPLSGLQTGDFRNTPSLKSSARLCVRYCYNPSAFHHITLNSDPRWSGYLFPYSAKVITSRQGHHSHRKPLRHDGKKKSKDDSRGTDFEMQGLCAQHLAHGGAEIAETHLQSHLGFYVHKRAQLSVHMHLF